MCSLIEQSIWHKNVRVMAVNVIKEETNDHLFTTIQNKKGVHI